ncbi:SOS response-associated peptidase [Fulvivirga sediminis]|uniref:Abasic site processing protein n=1 Tax=Fulvivirga sediminis TaxID=2803949 RepID=A0A937F2S7_9BACT|nr:SOS response-associated peptidase [Fulvivirga sediminis]MBL3655262.1 SOS response-associated peptidase [Fulvivirga sediminis]
MGDRYTITNSSEELANRFNVDIPDAYSPSYNAAPTQILPIITQGSKGLSFFYWGQIPDWSKNKAISNKLLFTNMETLVEKAITKKALLSRRCAVPADGFYGWKQVSKKGKIPYRVIFENKSIVSFAGLWEEFEDDNENTMHTFKLITSPSNSSILPMSTRMPVIMTEKEEAIWLNKESTEEELMEVLKTYPADKMKTYSVSPKISDSSVNEPALIEPMAPADQHGNYSLFD